MFRIFGYTLLIPYSKITITVAPVLIEAIVAELRQ